MSPIRKSLWKFFREEGVRAAGKTPVFGLLKRGGKVVVRMVSDCSRESLMPKCKDLCWRVPQSTRTASTAWLPWVRPLPCISQPQRVCQEEEPCERDRERTNLWFVRSFAKRRLAKFNGCSSDRFVVHLMECQWRYNRRNADLVRELAKILKRY